MTLRMDHVPGGPEASGVAHGAAIRDLVAPAFLQNYLEHLSGAIGFDLHTLRANSLAWLDRLPPHFALEIEAMARGAGVETGVMTDLLYADIAPAGKSGSPPGPMCSAIVARLHDSQRWVARNCDWLTPTLLRGTAAVVHETPHRIPIMAVGIRGDIDVDTGLNAEGVWLHLHTLRDTGPLPDDRPCISWLFWAREALETCATLGELEHFINTTARDRGVFVVAAERRTNAAAVFECGRGTYTRHDADDGVPMCITNHSLSRRDEPVRPEAPRPSRPTGAAGTTISPNVPGSVAASGTISRRRTMLGLIEHDPPEHGPDDLIAALAAPGVEMRTPRWLRTIYSAAVDLRSDTVWFASGTADGTPAASRGPWQPVRPPWVRRGF